MDEWTSNKQLGCVERQIWLSPHGRRRQAAQGRRQTNLGVAYWSPATSSPRASVDRSGHRLMAIGDERLRCFGWHIWSLPQATGDEQLGVRRVTDLVIASRPPATSKLVAVSHRFQGAEEAGLKRRLEERRTDGVGRKRRN